MILEFTAGAAVLGLIIFGMITMDQKKKSQLILEQSKKELESYGEVEIKDQKLYFTTQKQTYEVLFYRVGLHHELTINSRTMWEVKDASKPRLINQSAFLSSKYPKLIIVFPTNVVIKRYINENELEFVKYNKPFYDMYVMRHFELRTLLEEGVL